LRIGSCKPQWVMRRVPRALSLLLLVLLVGQARAERRWLRAPVNLFRSRPVPSTNTASPPKGLSGRRPGWLKRTMRVVTPASVGLSRILGSETAQWGVSSATLGAAESTYLATRTTPLLRGIQQLGFVGGAGLTYTALRDLRGARTWNERLDAAGDLAWGVEGMLEFSPVLGSKLGRFAPMVGTIGGICQTGAGLRRIWTGVRERDWCKVKLGALDTVSGGLWLAWDLFGVENPLVVGGFVGLMVGREAYANRDAIKARRWGARPRTASAAPAPASSSSVSGR